MGPKNDLTSYDCQILYDRIKKDIYEPVNTYKITVFLCGADLSDRTKSRFKFAQHLTKGQFSYLYDIISPEDVFKELLYGPSAKDLLTLENLLADSVDAIIIIPESAGSIAELGAFANDVRLRPKIVCLVDEKYKSKKSFINRGPIKLIKNENSDAVHYFDPANVAVVTEKLRTVLNKLKKRSMKITDKINLLQLSNFLLSSIYLLEPISRKTLIKLVELAIGDKNPAPQATTVALTLMNKKRHVEVDSSACYSLTPVGLSEFRALRHTKRLRRNYKRDVQLDQLRLEILNLKLRGKRMRV